MKHTLLYLSALLVLLSAGAVTACSDSSLDTTSTDTTSTQNSDAATAAVPSIYDVLLEKDYGQYEFRILNNISNFAYTNIGADGQTGESLDDAIYERNIAVEDALNIKLTITDMEWEPNKKAIETAVQAGEDVYDIYFNELHFMTGHAMNGYLIDQMEIASLNFENPWWNKTAIDSASVGDAVYASFGDLHQMYYECFIPVVFNKTIINNLDLSDPYQLVKDGTWTIDAMAEMMAAAKNDVDGDGKWTAADQYGISVLQHNISSFLIAAEGDVIAKNDDNLPVWEGLSDQFITVYDKLAATLFADKKNNADNADVDEGEAVHVMMQDGKALFYVEPLGSVKKMRNVDYEIGVVPMPKYDEEQESYRSYIYHGAGALGIPKTNADTERTGVIMEYMAAYSHEEVRDTYFNETLDFKYIQDEEGQAMLDILFSNGYFDLPTVYGWGDVSDKIRAALINGKTDVVSRVEKVSAKIESGIADTIEAFNDVE